ncbi:MAG: hypothetical protein JNM22_14225 [Saprospiraceae bacterium]|nr:hypothetical protein [Saprospiraceae bacterium]
MKHAYILLHIVLICTFLSCKKDPAPTIIKGIVVDSKTNEPISAASIALNIRVPSAHGQETTVTKYIKSDSEGHFSYTTSPDAISCSLYTITAISYAGKRVGYQEFEIRMEATNEFRISLIKLDAVLQIHVKNQHDQDNNVYIVVSNPTRLKEARYVWAEQTFWPFNIQIGTEHTLTIPVRSEEFTTIYWGNDNFSPFATAPFRDSLFINEGEVLNYFIEF